VFNIQEKITVRFIHVCTYTQDKHNIVRGVLGEGAAKPLGTFPAMQIRGLGSAVSSPSGVRGAAPRRPTDFSHFGVPRTALLRIATSQHEAPAEHG